MRAFRCKGVAAACAGVAAALLLHACASAPQGIAPVDPAAGRTAVQFRATVDRIEYSPLVNSDLNWAIYVKVDRILSGLSPGDVFSFRVRNPTREGIEVGRRFRIRAVPFGTGYQIVRLERIGAPPR